jgi:hypothetical protein
VFLSDPAAKVIMKHSVTFMELMLQLIWSHSPNATILLGTLTPEVSFNMTQNAARNGCYIEINARIRQLVSEMENQYRIR